MFGLNDIQYLYEFLFWFVTFFILKKVWHKPEVRLIYGYSVALFNLLAVFFFSLSSIKGEMNGLDGFAFGFLHTMVAVVMVTLVQMSKKLEK
ncbi:MAG: hypothetical protein CND43_00830 [Flavobacteriales bacterium MED-G15]|jgi:hypothetical protein|nr:MAG: hypothetical protein CND43_00830 [Flavobacteriales bacterium MED-G15]|tara:strand:- start:2015 stop:2290 length:276 start_codon:yes stop_codon:yes gene_type:complete